MIWSYLYPAGENGKQEAVRKGYGYPVSVMVFGQRLQAVYQFQGGSSKSDQQCCVVHFASGRAVTPIYDRHTGTPEQRAQAAVDERLAELQPADVWRAFSGAHVLNHEPERVCL